MEHFVTLFDSGYLPQGLALHSSLEQQGEPFTLWVVCMDLLTETILDKLTLPHLRTITLRDVETRFPALLDVKPGRSRAEYCWTLTPFTPEMVFLLQPEAVRATYLDADIFFFGPASGLLGEMDTAGADVMITDHAYAPEYIQDETSGKYCVQFVPFNNTEAGRAILAWWQERCVEWCFARFEDGKFGDQKYLESWKEQWPNSVHTLRNTRLTLAPWNANHLLQESPSPPGIFHFHGLRIFRDAVRLWSGYRISSSRKKEIYFPYLNALRSSFSKLNSIGFSFDPPVSQRPRLFSKARLRHILYRTEYWIRPPFSNRLKPVR